MSTRRDFLDVSAAAAWPSQPLHRRALRSRRHVRRMALIGDVPTLAEQGAKDFESGTYQGVMAAAGMPKANVDRLNAALVQVVRALEIRARLIELEAQIMISSARETRVAIPASS